MSNQLKRIVESRGFNRFIILVIVAAAVLIGLETSSKLMHSHGHLLHLFDKIILGIFTIEALMKIASHGKRPWRYFLDGWNVFDFSIVAVCFLPMDGQYAAVLRLARVLRVLRLVTTVPRLQLLVGALLKSIPSMIYVSVLLSILFYIYGIIGTFLFGKHDALHFGTLGASMLSLFQIVTMEGWVDLMYLQMYGTSQLSGQPVTPTGHSVAAVVYFVSFILLGTMIMLNLFIGVIMKSMSEVEQENESADRLKHRREYGSVTIADEIKRLERQVDALKESLTLVLHRVEQETPGSRAGMAGTQS
jgi:voltage-gated sodium channel